MRMPAALGRDDFDGFYQTHFGDTVTLSYAYTADLAEAQDIAQEAFSRAWQRWNVLAGYENPAAWVRRVAYNLAHSRWRRVKVAAAYLVRQRPEIAPDLNPDHVAVVEALRKLPRRQREAIVWHHIADLPVEDVAHELQVPVGTVKTWLQRGRIAMAKDLGIDVESRIAMPPSGEVVAMAQKRRRTRVTTLVAAIIGIVAVSLGAFQLLKPGTSMPPLTPSPSPSEPSTVDSDDPMRDISWRNVTITMPESDLCPSGTVTFDSDREAKPDREGYFARLARVALGDVTGDGRAEAAVELWCGKGEDRITALRLALIQRDSAGNLRLMGAADSLPLRRWTFWLENGVLHMDGSSFRDQPIGSTFAWKWNGSSLETFDSSDQYPPIGSIDLSSVAGQIVCQSLPPLDPAQLRLTFGPDLVLTVGDRKLDLNLSRTHPKFEERGRIGKPYLVLTLGCTPTGGQEPSWQQVAFDRIDGQWKAVSVTPGKGTALG